VEKATAAAHARQRVTFHPQAETSEKVHNKEPQKLKRRVSLGVAVNAETGEVIEGGTRQRQSQRSHTIMNTSATVNRMKDAEEKRVSPHLTLYSTHFTVPPAGYHSEESKSSYEGTDTG
jgi:vacuolar protein sorting-associated protein 72